MTATIYVDTCVRKRKCNQCKRVMKPGTKHIKFWSNNICFACFAVLCSEVIGPENFKDDFLDKALADVLSEKV